MAILGNSASLPATSSTRSGSKTVEGEPVTVTVDTNFDYDNYVHPEEEETQPESRSLMRSVGSGRVMPLAEGDSNVFFLDGHTFFRGPDEDSCTVDGCHPNDLGFHRMADHIERALRWALERV